MRAEAFLGGAEVVVVVAAGVAEGDPEGLSAFSTLVPLSFSNTNASDSSDGSRACNSAWSWRKPWTYYREVSDGQQLKVPYLIERETMLRTLGFLHGFAFGAHLQVTKVKCELATKACTQVMKIYFRCA